MNDDQRVFSRSRPATATGNMLLSTLAGTNLAVGRIALGPPMHSSVLQREWNELPVTVTARLVPRFAWQSASIDVKVGDLTILRTGGVYKITGEHSEEFQIKGAAHIAKVSWGKSALRSFPYRLVIDGQTIIESRVPIQNWWLSLWPWAVLLCAVAWRFSK